LFGFKKNKEKSDTIMKEKPLLSGEVRYVGGHNAYPNSGYSIMYFYDDRIDIWFSKKKILLTIPYSNIIKIENTTEKKDLRFQSSWSCNLIFAINNCRSFVEENTHLYNYSLQGPIRRTESYIRF
jgi:hypothetical protein